MFKMGLGDSFSANSYQPVNNQELNAGSISPKVDVTTGIISLINNYASKNIGIDLYSNHLSGAINCMNGHLGATSHPKISRPRFKACIAFLVDSETDVYGESEARELLIVDRRFKVHHSDIKAHSRVINELACSQSDNLSTKFASNLISQTASSNDKDEVTVKLPKTDGSLKCSARFIFQLDMDAQLAGFLTISLRRSLHLLRGFLNYTTTNCKHLLINRGPSENQVSTAVTSSMHVIVHLSYPQNVWLDYVWFYKLEALIVKQAILDDLMNWLSTLGGAYSSLGDHFVQHAENAGNISLQQLRVAKEMGSPPLVIRCHLFYAMSLMQRGWLRHAKILIRRQYAAAKNLPVNDCHLLRMCQGIWNRLKYLWARKRNISAGNNSSCPFDSSPVLLQEKALCV